MREREIFLHLSGYQPPSSVIGLFPAIQLKYLLLFIPQLVCAYFAVHLRKPISWRHSDLEASEVTGHRGTTLWTWQVKSQMTDLKGKDENYCRTSRGPLKGDVATRLWCGCNCRVPDLPTAAPVWVSFWHLPTKRLATYMPNLYSRPYTKHHTGRVGQIYRQIDRQHNVPGGHKTDKLTCCPPLPAWR